MVTFLIINRDSLVDAFNPAETIHEIIKGTKHLFERLYLWGRVRYQGQHRLYDEDWEENLIIEMDKTSTVVQ